MSLEKRISNKTQIPEETIKMLHETNPSGLLNYLKISKNFKSYLSLKSELIFEKGKDLANSYMKNFVTGITSLPFNETHYFDENKRT